MSNPTQPQQFPAPPIQTPFFQTDSKGNNTKAVSLPWVSWMQAISIGMQTASSSVPATSTSPGNPGQIAFDGEFIYVCVTQNTWMRSMLATF